MRRTKHKKTIAESWDGFLDHWSTASKDWPSLLRFIDSLKLSPRQDRLFAVACACEIGFAITDERGWEAILIAERFSDDQASFLEMDSADWRAQSAAQAANDRRSALASHTARATTFFTGNAPSVYAASYAVRIHWTGIDEDDRAGQMRKRLGEILWSFIDPTWVWNRAWGTSTVMALAEGIYQEKAFDRMPILGDALQDAGCEEGSLLARLRDHEQKWYRGCKILDCARGVTP